MGERYRDVIIRSASDGRPGRPPQRPDRGKCPGGKGGVYVRPKRLTPALPAQLRGGAFGGWHGMAWTGGAISPEIPPPKARSYAPSCLSRDRRSGRASVE